LFHPATPESGLKGLQNQGFHSGKQEKADFSIIGGEVGFLFIENIIEFTHPLRFW
jgi:hypothetical protein